ncbi:8-oxo-dGTP diphosphatase [Kineococcus radiotolerans]|uniref:8-oxo-dGTP diphosphatase n=1 Tax=Kineococcus radiotolerans TaxID=131568 RepID=A0A7W4TP22_KINRA|nr:NUDIX domain-containing protein [Kineococcus radiotolerans]MBB2902480.1 8-oxo-dGTP diphosphatase [Kineococcus radiotolerans]
MEFPPVAVTVDLVVLTVRDDGSGPALAVLLVERGEEPFLGRWALPGGFVRPDEDLPGAAARELAEETGLPRGSVHLEQLASYGTPDRDPRQRVVTVCYLALAPDLPTPRAGTDAADARWVPVARAGVDPGPLAFDHDRLLADAVERARAKLEYTPLATAFCAEEFTVAELRRVYEAVWGTPLDPRNFHRKVTGASGFLEPTGATTTRDGGRPARVFRRGPATALHPPLLRS